VSGSTDAATAAGANVIVLADRFRGGEWDGEEALALVKRLAASAPHAVILCAGALSRPLVDRAVGELRLARTRILGSAPEALAGGARALVALAGNASPRDVALTVLGAPPSHIVVPWEEATIGGFALTRMLDEPARRGIAARLPALWPPGPYALAAAAAAAIEAMSGRSRRVVSCFVGPDRSAGTKTRAAALPVRLGPSGIAQVVTPTLSNVERVALETAMML
jgi:malate dehydrogenase